jgi:hypothetical protein
MAARLGVPVGTGPTNATAEWAALALPRTAFGVVRNLPGEGGAGLIQPLWEGYNPDVMPATVDEADPDGTNGMKLLDTLTGFLAKA